MSNVLKLIFSIVICEAAGVIGSIFTSPSIATWYKTIVKPSFNPPNWIFGPVWTILFALMGIALFLVWKNIGVNLMAKRAILLFAIQLILNILWSVAFFGMKSPLVGFVIIILLWIAILLTILSFYKVSNVAGWLLIPYILWVSFASILNLAIVLLNK